ncbi:hypothetical protein [Cellulomonas sp. NPDC058312]|uniref:hypothetical protein n=1 Tax=Cellulomonas sp. NPDC058312 TaxID=3346441 RepID=UPI0036ECE173
MNTHISSIDLQLPERWCGWRPGDVARIARRAAAGLTRSPVADARLRSALVAVDRAVVEQNARHVRAGVWVPDPSGDVVGGLACELLVEAQAVDDPPSTHLRRIRRKIYRTRRAATRLSYHGVDVREVPAGSAVVTQRSLGVQRHEVIWTVFPPGSTQAVELRFDTRSRERYPELLVHAEQIALDLRVTLAAA